MLVAVRRAVGTRLEALAEFAGLALSLSGATAAAVLGKLLAAGVLGAVAVGFVLRLSSRRAGRVRAPAPMAAWVRPAAAALSVVEVAALVEATNLPVRFYQPGFAYLHWVLAAAAFFLAYLLQVRLLRLFGRERHELESP